MRKSDVDKEIERMIKSREKDMGKGLEIDYDTADRITLSSLKDHRKYLKKHLKDHSKGKHLLAEDVVRYIELISAFELIIPYYGGTND